VKINILLTLGKELCRKVKFMNFSGLDVQSHEGGKKCIGSVGGDICRKTSNC
jgi:hypothetical protein